ncbi:hypothetical protein [Paraburkholderia sp. BL10I2N1]|uniref:hypothetical protein n=1 Tax=Paraburkholderia sp. BL10I2N1 TaxID=1938796 RepID=UPI001FB621F3|nr:hypothetical protein [Paraburkholderia sp. BL10I2N1]
MSGSWLGDSSGKTSSRICSSAACAASRSMAAMLPAVSPGGGQNGIDATRRASLDRTRIDAQNEKYEQFDSQKE